MTIGGLGRGVAVAGVVALPVALAILVSALGGQTASCGSTAAASTTGAWIATAYGPPWTDGNGSGMTATGLDLTWISGAFI